MSWPRRARRRWEVFDDGGGEGVEGRGLGPGKRLGFFEQWEERWEKTAELCRRSGTMCMEWGRDEVEEIWREEGGGVGQGCVVVRR